MKKVLLFVCASFIPAIVPAKPISEASRKCLALCVGAVSAVAIGFVMKDNGKEFGPGKDGNGGLRGDCSRGLFAHACVDFDVGAVAGLATYFLLEPDDAEKETPDLVEDVRSVAESSEKDSMHNLFEIVAKDLNVADDQLRDDQQFLQETSEFLKKEEMSAELTVVACEVVVRNQRANLDQLNSLLKTMKDGQKVPGVDLSQVKAEIVKRERNIKLFDGRKDLLMKSFTIDQAELDKQKKALGIAEDKKESPENAESVMKTE
ncbi:hypothetical protein KAU11_01230 [Candidatus Babeliales bacterium]|nr:hypothetical protein [Candidatus Babeliales bacterium]